MFTSCLRCPSAFPASPSPPVFLLPSNCRPRLVSRFLWPSMLPPLYVCCLRLLSSHKTTLTDTYTFGFLCSTQQDTNRTTGMGSWLHHAASFGARCGILSEHSGTQNKCTGKVGREAAASVTQTLSSLALYKAAPQCLQLGTTLVTSVTTWRCTESNIQMQSQSWPELDSLGHSQRGHQG